ncbi:hypothetical protein KQI63_08495 [bacterium]|nr:hypothetical protein [bacterium]
MRTMIRLILPSALTLILIAGTGCEKKPPKGSNEVPTPTTRVPSAAASGVTDLGDGTIKVGPLKTTLPEGWESVQPASSMRKAQFKIPAAEGSEPGDLTVFYFGPDAGSVEANITRWMNQFTTKDGNPITEEMVKRSKIEVTGMPITMVQFRGNQKPSSMPGMTPTPMMPDYMNISGIVLSPDGPWFFKGYGPEKTMEAHVENFQTFFKQMQYVGMGH